MKNQGISLISLIITIIVIIILAAIVIFTGLGTPDSAQFSNFCSQVDNVYVAMMDAYGDLRVDHAVSGETRTNEQIYLEIATGTDWGQYVVMGNNKVVRADNTAVQQGAGCQLIKDTATAGNGVTSSYTAPTGATAEETEQTKTHKLNMKLPKVRENSCAWYVTEDGKVFNTTGYIYDEKTYFNASIFFGKELAAVKGDTEADRAQIISDALMADENTTVVTGMDSL